jgi:hypothetical protein
MLHVYTHVHIYHEQVRAIPEKQSALIFSALTLINQNLHNHYLIGVTNVKIIATY